METRKPGGSLVETPGRAQIGAFCRGPRRVAGRGEREVHGQAHGAPALGRGFSLQLFGLRVRLVGPQARCQLLPFLFWLGEFLNRLQKKGTLILNYCGWLRNPSRTTVQKPGMIRFPCKYQQTMVSHGFKVVQDFVHPQ